MMRRAALVVAALAALAVSACKKESSVSAPSFPMPADGTPAAKLVHKEAPRAIVESFIAGCTKEHPRVLAMSIAPTGTSSEIATLRMDAGQGKATPTLKKVIARYANAKTTGHAQEGDRIIVKVALISGESVDFAVAGTPNNWLVLDFPIPK